MLKPCEHLLKVIVTPNHIDWTYEVHLKKSTNEKNIPKRLYFLKALFSNGKTIRKEIMKL